MDFNTNDYIDHLSEMVHSHITYAQTLPELDFAVLNQQPGPGRWNALQCLEHLNLYAEYYVPEIQNRLDNAHPNTKDVFQSGWLGNYLAESMLPKPDKPLNKMKAFRKMNPDQELLSTDNIDDFIAHQKQVILLLDRARGYDLTKIKTSISITTLIKLRLGDTFRFMIYHNERHVQQAKNALLEAGVA